MKNKLIKLLAFITRSLPYIKGEKELLDYYMIQIKDTMIILKQLFLMIKI